MRDSADSDDYGVTRRGKKRGKSDPESTYAKRDRHLPRLAAEDARDATDGLTEGDRWSTWDQTEDPIPKHMNLQVSDTDADGGVGACGAALSRRRHPR